MPTQKTTAAKSGQPATSAPADPDQETPAGDLPAPTQLSPEAVQRLRARLVRKYH